MRAVWNVYRGRDRADMRETSAGLYEELVKYGESDYYPYHMPGHKRNKEAGAMAQYYGIDITEIDGFDNLHHAEGILQEAQQRANSLYGNDATETFYLINGSTCGILASIMAVTEKGDEILIARNCHKSVYHAAIFQELNLRYYYPPVLEEYGICGGVSAEEIVRLIRAYPMCKAIVITSPTYEGLMSDVRAIAEVVHAYDKILIVDEAHGAHLGLCGNVPAGAVAGGADLVIHSLHKTLPSMTQTALLHVQGERVDRKRLRRYLGMLQTSSPSYVLMASIDSCIRYMECSGAAQYAHMKRLYDSFYKEMEKCRYIRIGSMQNIDRHQDTVHVLCVGENNFSAEKKYHIIGWDIGKLVIYVRDRILNGRQLYDLLRDDYHLQMEMAAENYVLAIMTIMDTQEGWQRLADALQQIDDRIEEYSVQAAEPEYNNEMQGHGGVQDWQDMKSEVDCIQNYADRNSRDTDDVCGSMTAARAYLGRQEEVALVESAGRVAADFLNLYPPGIPLVAPGEIVCGEVVQQIRRSMQAGLQVQGVTPEERIMVVPSE